MSQDFVNLPPRVNLHIREIRDQFIDKCSFNRLRRRLRQKPNLTLENVVEKAQTMKLAKMQSIVMQSDEMQA